MTVDTTRLVLIETGDDVAVGRIAMDREYREERDTPHHWRPSQFKKNGTLRLDGINGTEIGARGWGKGGLGGAIGFYDAERERAAETMRGVVAIAEQDLLEAERKLQEYRDALLAMYASDQAVQVSGAKPEWR